MIIGHNDCIRLHCMRMWVLAIAVAVLGFNGMVGAGWIEARQSIYAGPQLLWLSSLVGGLLFGFGIAAGTQAH